MTKKINLRNKLIKLAYEKPYLREHLLPLIKSASKTPLTAFIRGKGQGYVLIHNGLNKLEAFNEDLLEQAGSLIRPRPVVDLRQGTVHVYDSRTSFDAEAAVRLAREHGITLTIDPDVGPWGHPNDTDRYILSKIKRSGMHQTLGESPQQILKDWRKLQNYIDHYGHKLMYGIGEGKYSGGHIELEQKGQTPDGWFDIDFRLYGPEGELISKEKVNDFVAFGDIMDYVGI